MADTDLQAHEFVRQHNWSRAMAIYDQLLAPATTNFKIPKDKIIACLLGRCECYLELGKYESCICDAKRVLKMLSEQTDCGASIARVRRRLIHSFYKLKRFQEAEVATKEWITEASAQPSFVDISKTLDRYKAVIQMANGHKTNSRISLARLDEEMGTLDTKLEHWATNNLPLDKYSKLLTNKGIKKREASNGNGTQKLTDQLGNLKMNDTNENQDGSVTCSYCTMSFQDKNELRQHCQTESHQNVIMSDEGRDWKWRPPPRGYTLDSYTLCESYTESSTCHYGNQCVEAHGVDELNEWKERFEYRKMRLQRAFEKELYGKTYTEELLEKWVQSTNPEKVMREKIDGVDEQCSNELVTTISSKVSKREWLFTFKTRRHLKAVALLQDAHRHHFSIKSIIPGDSKATNLNTTNSNTKKSGNTSSNNAVGSKHNEAELKSDQEWVSPTFERTSSTGKDSVLLEHKVRIVFSTDIYGTFRQSVCFDFDSEPVLVKHLCVDVVPVSDAEKIQEIKNDIINSTSQRWDDTNSNVIKFETTIASHLKTEAYLNDIKREKDLLERYPCPRASTFTLTQSTIVEKRLTKNNYRSRIHELLYVEEIARYEQIARYNLSTKLRIASNYMLTPSGMATSTAKYSHSGELFGLMTLGKDISEDTSAGRLILSNCLSVYLAEAVKPDDKPNKRRDVYECMIEDKGKNMIYLKLSAKCVQGLNLKPDTDFKVDIQFQLNRLSYCEWHNAVDKIADFRIIFPDTVIEPNIPWTPKKQWSDSCDPKLNTKQKEAINAITTPITVQLPPILLIGPFGTGKTYTLAQAIKQLLLQPEAKILICTHSNSAADLYIKEYLHPWVEKGMKEATPLRVYYHKRWVATVNGVVQKYCIIDGNGNFRRPTVDDILKHRIVVVTLSISMELASLDLPKGHFTHIFLDEAAQAMECEAIMPLALASEDTRIVLAGDHMQMSPELFSNFAKERKLHISLLERLYDHYTSNFPCKILLCENYRAHEAIIKFTSELFYEQKLIASGKQPRHDKFYPLTFFTTRGEDVQDKNSTAFYNNSEVYEVVERVCELRKKWPSSWGKINDQSIGIMTPYADQVFRIRSELRKRRMGGISVERVLNVQGKQFRAIFLSTVRTRRTCTPSANSVMGSQTDDADFGFLSNSKLLNTAITRAQSLVAVVGDPVALCSIGRCRKVWERFIDICNQNRSLFGITWSCLRSQLDGVELKRSYVLNPLAPEFVPRSLQPESYLRKQAINIANSAHQNMQGAPQGPQLPSTYGIPGYGVLNPAGPNPAIPSQQTHAAAHHSPMQGRPMGPPNQGYNLGGPQQVQTNQQQQFSPYLIWPPTQQSGPLIRPNYAPQQQNPQQPPPQQLSQNPNASLWGPPPQTNPWGVIPKPMVNPNIRPTSQPQPPQNQSMNMNMNNMGMRPPAPPAPPLQQQQLQPIRNPQDLSYLSKFVYQNTTPYNNQNHVVLNQIRNQMPNGPASPAMATGHDMVSTLQRVNHAPNSNAMTQPYINSGQQALMSKEKEFQFLNNVHNIPLNMTSNQHQQSIIPPSVNVLPPPAVPNSSASHPMLQLQEYNYLLPHNMSFYEMALEPKEFQYKWYLRLLEVQGQDSANKFTELLRQVMMSTNSSNSNVNNIRQSSAGKNVLLHQQQNINPNPAARGGIPASGAVVNNPTVPAPDNNINNFNQQIDLVFNQLMNGNEISQPILRDLLGMVGTAAAPTVPNPVLPKETQHLPQNNSFLNCTNDLALSSRVESIPLYRRQVVGNGTVGACSTTSSSSNTQSCASSTPELSQDSSNSNANRNTMNIMESLFHPNNLNNYGNFHSVQKMLYGYQIKNDEESDILIGSRPINPQMPSQQQQQHPHQQHHALQHKQQQPQHHTTSQQINHNSNTGNTTYASVLSQGNVPSEQNHDHKRNQPHFNRSSVPDEQDPFAAIRELGERSNGYYNYFQ